MEIPIIKLKKKEQNPLEVQKNTLIRNWGKNKLIIADSVLKAFQSVKRELFIDPSQYELSYSDQPLPIGSGQTISQPTTVVFMLQLLDVLPGHSVLEIGTGSGYNAALLANLAKLVVTVERLDELAKQARKNLITTEQKEVKVIKGDGKLGYTNLEPYDRIIITAATNEVPQNLKDQLKVGGLLVAPIGPTYRCEMLKLRKISSNNFDTSSHGIFSFVPLI